TSTRKKKKDASRHPQFFGEMSFMSILRFHQFNLTIDLNLITNQHAATFKGCVPIQTKLFTVKFACHSEPSPCITPGVLLNAAKFNIKNYGFCHTANRKVALQRNIITIAGITGRLKNQLSILV